MKHSERSSRNKAAALALVLFLSAGTSLFAQDPGTAPMELRGRIQENGVGIPSVHIVNLSSEAATISDAQGFFGIQVRETDTLLISGVRYQRKTLRITRKMMESVMLEIPMQPFVNELDEVVLWPYNLTGDLDEDLSNVPVDEPVTAQSLGLPNANAKIRTQTERKLFEATSGSGLIPLNPILNALSGRTRMLKKRLARDRAYQQTLEVRALYPDSLFTGDLGIPQVRIPDFMYFCETDPAFGHLAEAGDRLRMWEFLKGKSGEYRKNNKID